MPDANGKIKGYAPTRKTAAAWERIFGRRDEFAKLTPACEKMGFALPSPDQ